MFGRNSTVVLSKDVMSSTKLVYLLKRSVSSPYDGSLYVTVKFIFAEASPGFPCKLLLFLHFYFLVHCESPLYTFHQHYHKMNLHDPLEWLIFLIFFKIFESFGVFGDFSNSGLAAPFDTFGSFWNAGLFLGCCF